MEGEDSPYRDIWHYEIACLNNLNVMSVDEALSLVPSLNSLGERIAQRKGLSDPESINVEEIIKNLLEDIKRFQMQ